MGPNDGAGRNGDQCGHIYLLPYMDQAPVYNQIRRTRRCGGVDDSFQPWRNSIPTFLCPSVLFRERERVSSNGPLGFKSYHLSVGTTINDNYAGATTGCSSSA